MLLSAGLSVQTRSQALGLCQVLMDEGVLAHGEIIATVVKMCQAAVYSAPGLHGSGCAPFP